MKGRIGCVIDFPFQGLLSPSWSPVVSLAQVALQGPKPHPLLEKTTVKAGPARP